MRKSILFFGCALVITTSFAQGKFVIATGTHLKTANGVNIVLSNTDLVNNGSFLQPAGGGTLKLTGNNNSTISGGAAITIDKLLMNKSEGITVNLQRNVSVVSDLRFAGGLLNLNNFSVNLGSTGMLLDESTPTRAYTLGSGFIESTRALNAPMAVNVANLGAVITSRVNMGNTVVRRYHKVQSNGSGASVLRYFLIRPSVNSSLNATLRFQYLEGEKNGLTESTLIQWISSNGTSWTQSGFDSRSTSSNYVEKKAIPSFQYVTLMTAVATVSAVQKGTTGDMTELTAFPNPVKEYTMLDLQSFKETDANIALYDSKGMLVRSYDRASVKGLGRIRIDVQDLPQGSYTLKVTGRNKAGSIHLIKN